jgi:hypothetical protein
MTEKILVLEVGKRAKLHWGKYVPNENCGIYGKKSFAIPEHLQQISKTNRRQTKIFIVDPITELAQPVGETQVTDMGLSAKLEVCTNKKYVKAMVLRVFDTLQILIYMGAGIGVMFLALKILQVVTGKAITI